MYIYGHFKSPSCTSTHPPHCLINSILFNWILFYSILFIVQILLIYYLLNGFVDYLHLLFNNRQFGFLLLYKVLHVLQHIHKPSACGLALSLAGKVVFTNVVWDFRQVDIILGDFVNIAHLQWWWSILKQTNKQANKQN